MGLAKADLQSVSENLKDVYFSFGLHLGLSGLVLY